MPNKDAYSHLIQVFLHHVAQGRISAKNNTEAETVLSEIAQALHKIRSGVEPDDALEIERKKGRSHERYTIPLAYKIHHWRSQSIKWAVVEIQANDWLAEKNFKNLSLSRLKNLYEENKKRVAGLYDNIEQHRQKNKK